FPETLVKSLEYQQEWVKSYLTAQETATKVALDSQKQFWDSYFGFARQSMAVINKPA
ncbi:MAG: thylakoid-associated protein, partial [Microcystis aeruginosa Ma_AC_P_19900807_S299]